MKKSEKDGIEQKSINLINDQSINQYSSNLILEYSKMDSTTSKVSKLSSNYRLPYHYPPDRHNVGQLNYGTFFENGSEIPPTSPPQLLSSSLNFQRTTSSLNHHHLPSSSFYDYHQISEESSRYSRYRYYNRLFNSSSFSTTTTPTTSANIGSILPLPQPEVVINRKSKSPINRQHRHRTSSSGNNNFLWIPDHVLPWYFLLKSSSNSLDSSESSEDERLLDEEEQDVGEDRETGNVRQSSIVTIFAIWNMMMGTSLLCLPWAMHRAGLVGGLLSMILMIGLCFYTASLVIHVPQIVSVQVVEFTDLVAILLGSFAHKVAQISSLSIITGGCIVYWILMNNFLRHVVTFVYQVQFLNTTVGLNLSSAICTGPTPSFTPFTPSTPSFTPLTSTPSFTPSTSEEQLLFNNVEEPNPDNNNPQFDQLLSYSVPLILTLILGPIMCLRSVSIFLRFNIVGTFSVFYLIAFSLIKAYSWGLFSNYSSDPGSIHYIPLFSWNFPIYTGVLSLALFIHNCLTTLLRTQRNPENNYRDLAIAYVLVGFTYLLIGVSIYVGFPLEKSCIKDNFLDNLESNDLFAFITRIFLLLQVVALFPLLVYMLRIQALSLFEDQHASSGRHNPRRRRRNHHPKLLSIFILNVSLLTICILFAAYYPQIGSIIRYCGSFSGFLLIFTLPPLTFIRARQISDRPIRNVGLLILGTIILFGFGNFVTQFLVHA